jgi:glycosyltransferase involved in cell wall biosynthesis
LGVEERALAEITIITPHMNRPHLLKRAINSVLSQDFQDWEQWVLDNSTKVEYINKAESICRIDPRIKFFHRSFSKAERLEFYVEAHLRNEAYQLVDSRLIVFLSDDDTWTCEFLSTLVPAVDDSIWAVYCPMARVLEKPGEFPSVEGIHFPNITFDRLHSPKQLLDGGAVVHTTRLLEFLEQPFFLEDWEHAAYMDGVFLEKLACLTPIYPVTPLVLLQHRITEYSWFQNSQYGTRIPEGWYINPEGKHWKLWPGTNKLP